MDDTRTPHRHAGRHSKVLFSVRLVLMAIALILLTGPAGCRQSSKRVIGAGGALPKNQLSRQDLWEVLNRFEDFFAASVKQGANDLDTLLPGAKTQRLTLLWRARCIGALHTILEQDDPLVAFIDAWALSLRMTLYFGSGEGSKLFEPQQGVALSTAVQIETEIERVAQTLLERTIFEQTQRDLRAFAQANPIRGAFSKTLAYASEVKKGTPGPVETVVNLPLAPFRTLEGVDRGAAAIRDFSITAERFGNIVEELPESTRWQLLLTLYELEEMEIVRSFLAGLARIAESNSALTEASEKLPSQIRAELSTFVDQVDAKQANLQQTLQDTQATTEALTALAEQVENTAAIVTVAAAEVQQTAQAWQGTVESIGTTFNLPKTNADANQASKFDMAQLDATARTITEAATEIRKLNEELAANTGILSAHIHSLTTEIIWKLALLITLAFVLALIYRTFATRLIPSERRRQR